MGLDMNAARRLYVKQWEHQSPEERYTVQITRGGEPLAGIQSDRISDVEEEVMRWWNAVHIHRWFVRNVQGGHDDCMPYHVDWPVLRRLHVACRKVTKASKLVPGEVLAGEVWNSEDQTWVERREPGKIIENPTIAIELLPASSGYFFREQDYDERYLNHVVRTQEWAERMLADYDAGVPGEIYYSSSW